jgi:hypothetical protein
MLAPGFDPTHRARQPARKECDQQVLGIDVALAAKSAADIERYAPHARLRHAKETGSLAAYPMNHLGRGPDRHRIGAWLVGADDAAAFHRYGGVAVVIEAAPQTVRRARKCGIEVPSPDRETADQVGVKSIVNNRAVRSQSLLEVDDRRQYLEIAISSQKNRNML